MAKDPAFLMYYTDWLVSTATMDADVRGWYINLLCHQADKPSGLPNDTEELAKLAGVKFSEYDRFAECWKHTLEAKFEANDKGLLVNAKQNRVIESRKEFTNKQTTRGLIGYYIKLAKSEYELTKEEGHALYKLLEAEDLLPKTNEQRLACYKRTLIALLGNENGDGDGSRTRGGLGGNKTRKLNSGNNGKQFSNFAAQGEEVLAGRHSQARSTLKVSTSTGGGGENDLGS